METLDQTPLVYEPTEEEIKVRKKVYDDFSVMRDLRNQRYKYFNDRTLKEFIDDSELRLSNYVPTREEQGKEEWQANFSHPVTSNKMNAILASVALDVPEVRIVARNEKNDQSLKRAYIIKNLVKHSYDKDDKEEQVYFEGWETAGKGTCIIYDGYQKQKAKRKKITSYDPYTGKVEFTEESIETKNGCVEFIVPLENIFIWNFYIPNIQDQPKLCWVESMGREEAKAEFGKYPNFKFVKDQKKMLSKDIQARYFYEAWASRVKGSSPYEIVRYYNRFNDHHVILANGVVLYDGPMLLGRKQKVYPFAKTVYSLFSADFFYGNSLPNKMMGEQDVINALYNMSVDKTYKSMVPSLLIGNQNKDDFDLEDPYISLDTKIYVQDINAVKQLEFQGINNADVKMIDLISRGLDLTTVDSNQQGVQGRGVTAREVVISNENARKLKGTFYMFLTSLWIQKIKLRIINILTWYTKVEQQKELGKDMWDKYKKYIIENADLGDGKKGTLEVNIAKDESELPTEGMLDQRSQDKSKEVQDNYKAIAMTSDFLDGWEYDVKVVSESVYQQDSSLSQAKMEDKIKIMATAFPQYFQMNQEKLFKEVLISYEDDPDEYDTQQQPQGQPGQEQGGQPQQPGQPQPNQAAAQTATAGQAGMAPVGQ
jgi:hypothetical protein